MIIFPDREKGAFPGALFTIFQRLVVNSLENLCRLPPVVVKENLSQNQLTFITSWK